MAFPRRILCPIDFSECSKAALDKAVMIAGQADATLDVLHVVEFPVFVHPELIVRDEGGTGRPLGSYVEEQLRVEMQGVLRTLDETARRRVSPHIVMGNVVDNILAHAARQHSDVIVMGTRGRRHWSHAFMGSVAERVVQRAACPVLVVPNPRRSSTET